MNRVPPVTDELLDYLDRIFPNVVPNITDSDREVWAKVGEQRVIEHLNSQRNRQRQNVLKDSER